MNKKRYIVCVAITVIACMIFSSCALTSGNTSKSEASSPQTGTVASDSGAGISNSIDKGTTTGQPIDNIPSSSIPSDGNIKLIYSVNLYMETTEFDKSVASIDQLVKKYNGYYEYSNISEGSYNNTDNRIAQYTIRIPVASYTAFLGEVGNTAHVVNKSENAKNVSEEYFDIEARLSTLRVKQQRLTALLEKAATMENIIAIENSLSDTNYQIEEYTSRLKKLDALIDYSTVSVNLTEVYKLTNIDKTPNSFWARISNAFKSGFSQAGRRIEDVVVGVVYLIPVIILLLIIAGIAAFIFKRKNAKKSANSHTENEKKE